MGALIPFAPPLAPPAAMLDPRQLVVDVEFRGTELVAALELRHPAHRIAMRLYWTSGRPSIVEYPPAEAIPAAALEAYGSLVDRLACFAFFLESHAETSANDVRLVTDALFPTVTTGASS